MKAYKNIVIIVRDDAAKQTESGIILPDNSAKTGTGTVYSSGVKTLKKGVEVVFAPYAGVDIDIKGSKYTLLKDEDILATL